MKNISWSLLLIKHFHGNGVDLQKQAFQIRGNHTGSRMHFSIQSNLLNKPTLSETKPNPTTRSQMKVGI